MYIFFINSTNIFYRQGISNTVKFNKLYCYFNGHCYFNSILHHLKNITCLFPYWECKYLRHFFKKYLLLKQQKMLLRQTIPPRKTVVTTVFYVGSVFFKNKYPVVLTRIYVKTTGNVFALENTPIKNCCNNSRQHPQKYPNNRKFCCFNNICVENNVSP